MKKLSFDIAESDRGNHDGLMKNPLIAFFLGKPDGSLLEVNQAGCDLFGYTAEEFTKLSRHDYVEFDDAALDKLLSERREKGSIKTEFMGIKKNGERFPIEIFSVIFKNADGEERTGALMSDISERKKTEEALVRARQQFEGLVNTVNGIVWEANAHTFAFSFVSSQAEVLLGYPVQQWLDEPTFWEDHIHPDDREWAMAFCEKNVKEKKSHKFEYRMIAADGSIIWLQDIVSVIVENDKPTYITGLMIDITERKNTAVALQKSYEDVLANESLLKSAEKLAHFGSWSADMVSGETKWSDEAFRIYGYRPGTIIPSLDLFLSSVHPDDVHFVKENIKKAMGSSASQKMYFRILDKSGEVKYIHAEHLVERNIEGAVIRMTGFNMDITEKIQLEEKLAHEKSQKHQEITEAVITAQEQERKQLGEELHDNINQILATARLYIESAINDTNPRKDLMIESKNYIISAVNEIRELSRSLLPPSLGVISLSEALKDLIETYKKVNKLTCVTKWETLDDSLISEKLKLTIFRIVQEQMNNIITHSNAKTAIIQLLNRGKDIQLLIKDDGIGFDLLLKRRGVGLQNITSRAELFGGNVSINTAPGEGCELIIDFKLN